MEANKRVTKRVKTLRSTITPLLLESMREYTTDVLSVGRRCMTEGYSFQWESGMNPYFTDRKGRRLELCIDRYIPYLDDTAHNTAPATTPLGYAGEPEDSILGPLLIIRMSNRGRSHSWTI
eukprot:6491616-Amphidinium_carterae.4